uniref:Uncharacterized protein n=1 Tax=Micrococcus phage Olihed TaxID=3092209 RepID=A0AAU6R5U9_9CAUD
MASKGIVVEHKGNGMQFAVSEVNFNPKTQKKVRDLKPGESVLTYRPRHKQSLAEVAGAKTEGANTGTQEKEGK